MAGPKRAHELICSIGADTAKELAWRLRHFADDIERGQITVGCSGGPSSGTIYSYQSRPEMTHDEYFRQLDIHLNEMAAAELALTGET